MNDLAAGWVMLLVISVAGFAVGRGIGRKASSLGTAVLALLTIFAVAIFAVAGADCLFWARLLPWSGVVVPGLSTLPLVALLCGLVLSRPVDRVPVWRQRAGAGLLLALAAFQSVRPFVGPVPEMLAGEIKGGVCMQTSEASCSAASAVTLLARHGVPASEREMAALCLTREEGTPMLGVYRGLSLKVREGGTRVRVFTGADVAGLRRAVAENGPVLLSVGIDRWQRVADARYVREWGWTPGRRHAVVLLGFLPGGKIDIGDPSVGRETWREDALATLWHGEGLLIEVRQRKRTVGRRTPEGNED